MRYIAGLILVAVSCFAGEPARPVCNARNRGQFWPEQANGNQDAAGRLSRSGDLEMCSLVVWKYKWVRLTVNAKDLAKDKPRAASHAAKAAPENH